MNVSSTYTRLYRTIIIAFISHICYTLYIISRKEITAMWSTHSLEELSFTTKGNKHITFNFIFDSEGHKNNGSLWIVHKLEAYVDNKLAGFMTTSYIPEGRWNNTIENTPFDPIIVSADFFGGASLGFRFASPDNMPEEHNVLQKLSLSVAYDMHRVLTEENVGTDEYEDAKDFVIKRAIRKHKEKYDSSKSFHVEKPLVDYISTEDGYTRQGIAHALYYTMASIVCENGYRLRSSGLKTDDGQAHFNAFARNYPEIITKEDGYYFVDINLEDNIAYAC